MREISWASGATNRLRFTSHAHCAKKISSSVPATTCGRPNGSGVKNLPKNRERVFYHVGQRFRKNPRMDEPQPSPPPAPDEPSRPAPETPAFSPIPVHPLHKFFLGPEGLRVGWRLFLYAAAATTMYMVLGAALYYLPDLGIRGGRIDLIAELGRLGFVAAIPTLLMARIEGRPFGSYGLPRQGGFGKLFWGGAGCGNSALPLLMLCLHWAGDLDFGSVVLHGRRLVKVAGVL